MVTKNAIRVVRFRQNGGNLNYKEKYRILRDKYGLDCKLANKLKFWSPDRINDYLRDNDIRPLQTYRPKKEADRL